MSPLTLASHVKLHIFGGLVLALFPLAKCKWLLIRTIEVCCVLVCCLVQSRKDRALPDVGTRIIIIGLVALDVLLHMISNVVGIHLLVLVLHLNRILFVPFPCLTGILLLFIVWKIKEVWRVLLKGLLARHNVEPFICVALFNLWGLLLQLGTTTFRKLFLREPE